MHIQWRQMQDKARGAHEAGRPVALGGPSVSASPDYYPEFDYLHVGELGDATCANVGFTRHCAASTVDVIISSLILAYMFVCPKAMFKTVPKTTGQRSYRHSRRKLLRNV
jgi:hypothetical protein